MQERAQRTASETALTNQLTADWTQNQVDVYALDEQDMGGLWIDIQRANGQTDEHIIAS